MVPHCSQVESHSRSLSQHKHMLYTELDFFGTCANTHTRSCTHTHVHLHTHTHTHTIITPIFNNVALEKLKQKEQCNWKRRFVIHPFFPFFSSSSSPFFFFFLHLQHTEMMTSLKYLIKKGKILQCEDIFACKESHQQSSSDILLRRQMLR